MSTTHTLIIKHDYCIDSPRDWDNLGKIYAEHRRYNLKDSNASDIRDDDGHISNDYIYLNVYMYEHGGVALNTSGFSCPWDSGQVGYIYVSKVEVLKNWGRKRMSKKLEQKVYKCLQAEIETYSMYLNGDVYGYEYQELSEEGRLLNEDSCWGFFGSNPEKNGMVEYIGRKNLEQCEVIYQ